MTVGFAGTAVDGVPDPRTVTDLGEFIGVLGQLRAWAGQPSYRDLAKRVGPLLRPPRTVSPATVVDAFNVKRRRLDLDLVVGIVRALGLGECEVAHWREACVRMHARAKTGGPAGVLRQLPADLPTFTGRRAELALLTTVPRREAAGAATAVVHTIEGMAGVGKTRLAVHAAHEMARAGRFADTQLYVNLHGFDPVHPPSDPAEVLDGFLRALGVPGQYIPAGRQQRSAMFRDRLHQRDALLLLDDAADAEQVSDLIPASPGCLVLITSRRSLAGLDGGTTVRLDGLEPAASLTLLGQIAGTEKMLAEPAAAAAVAATCGQLPLALSLVAARLRNRPTWSVADLLTELRVGGLPAMAVGSHSVSDAFDESLAALDPEQRRMFLNLGLCPGKDIGAEAAALMAGTTVTGAKALMDSLVDEHLALSPIPGRFTLHRVLRGYAAGKAAEEIPESQQRASLWRVLRWYTARIRDTAAYRPPKAKKLLAQVPALTADGDTRDLSDAWRAIGHAHLWSEEFEAAERAYRRALRLTPSDGNQTPTLLGIRQACRQQALSDAAA